MLPLSLKKLMRLMPLLMSLFTNAFQSMLLKFGMIVMIMMVSDLKT